MAVPMPEWWNTVEQGSATLGVNPSFIAKLGGVESGFRNVPNGDGTSSATGPFQFTEDTWNGLRTRYRDLGLGDRTNPAEQARAIPYLVRENRDYLARELKRGPSDGEQYLAHFLGAAGASRALRADPTTPLASVIAPSAMVANQRVFGSMRSVADLVGWADKKMGGQSQLTGTEKYGAGPQFPEGKVPLAQAQPPSPYTTPEITTAEKARAEQAFSLTQGAWEALKQESTIRWAFENAGKGPPDPNFVVTADLLKERAPQVKPEHFGYLRDAHSLDDFDDRMARLKRDLEVDAKLDAMGAKSIGLRIVGSILDPGGWLLSAATGPLANAVKLGRLGRPVAAALNGAAGNMLAEIPMAANKPSWERDQLLYAAAGGALFGSVFGRSAFDNPAIAKDVADLHKAGSGIMREIEQRYGPELGDSAGAMRNPTNVEPVRGDVSDFLHKNFVDSDVAEKGALSSLRFDVTGRLKASENPLARALGNLLGEETVGQADKAKATFRAITEDQQMLQRRYDTVWGSAYKSAWDDFRSRSGLGWAAGMNGEETKFRQSVTAAMRNVDPTQEFDPAVQALAGTWRELNRQWLTIAKGDHRSLDGTIRNPMRGFEHVDPSEHYVPRIVHWDRFRNTQNEFGTRNMETLIEGAIRGRNPDLDPDIAAKIAKGYVKRLSQVDAGQELSASRMFSGQDVEGMRGHLREAGLLDDEIEKALFEATAKDQSKAAIARGKPRTLLDENFSMELQGKGGTREVRIAELFHDDAMLLVGLYNRQMSGAAAMSRLRVENPNWRPGEGDLHARYLIDGVHGRGDWDTLMAKVRAVASDPSANPKARETVEADVRRLQFMFDGITGTPSAFDRTKGATYLRMFRDYNFIRVMGQVGFAQVAEVGMITGGVGLKTAISSVPSLRSFFRAARTGALREEDAKALEWISTGGTDYIRGIGHAATDDFGSPITHVGRHADDLAGVRHDRDQHLPPALGVPSGPLQVPRHEPRGGHGEPPAHARPRPHGRNARAHLPGDQGQAHDGHRRARSEDQGPRPGDLGP